MGITGFEPVLDIRYYAIFILIISAFIKILHAILDMYKVNIIYPPNRV